MNYESKFWKKSYDAGLEDIDPKMWETTYPDAVKRTFEEFPGKSVLQPHGGRRRRSVRAAGGLAVHT